MNWEDELRNFLTAKIRIARGSMERDYAPHFDFHYANIEHLVLDAGKFYPPRLRPEQYRKRERGHCFWNALSLAVENPDSLYYCEGFATEGQGFDHHAWNVDVFGEVVDTTWHHGDANEHDNPKGYYGIVLPLTLVETAIRIKTRSPLWQSIGALDDPFNGWPLLRERYDETRAGEILRGIELSRSR